MTLYKSRRTGSIYKLISTMPDSGALYGVVVTVGEVAKRGGMHDVGFKAVLTLSSLVMLRRTPRECIAAMLLSDIDV